MGYILFSSEEEISIQVCRYPRWNGIIEYSYDNQIWQKWRGEEIINNNIYMRGIKNTIVSGGDNWIINGKNVKCQGNIENLLDYRYVVHNFHPKMGAGSFSSMFAGCNDLIEAPQLLSEKLLGSCYQSMFWHCTSLTQAPKLSKMSAFEITKFCYFRMFEGCSLLTETSNFPSLSIAKKAIINQCMFDYCPIQKVNINNKLYDINVLKLL